MSVCKLNVLSCDLDQSLDEAGFRHTATSIGARLGAERIGAGLYEACLSAHHSECRRLLAVNRVWRARAGSR